MVNKIPDINEVLSWTQDTELPKIPPYQNLEKGVRESFEWIVKSATLQRISMEDLLSESPQRWISCYYVEDHKTYITISALPMLYNTATTQYSIAVYGENNTGFFYLVENPTQSIWAKLQELVLGLEKK